jgi:hypothetical protein
MCSCRTFAASVGMPRSARNRASWSTDWVYVSIAAADRFAALRWR